MQTYTVTFRNSDNEVKQYIAPLNRDDLKTEAELLSRCGCTRVTIKDDAGRMVFFGSYPDAQQPIRGWSKFMAAAFGFAASLSLGACADLGSDYQGVYDPYGVRPTHRQVYQRQYTQQQPRYQPRQAQPRYYGQEEQPRYYRQEEQPGSYGRGELQRDEAECQRLAGVAARNNFESYAGAGLKGGAVGAGLGALAGAVFGFDPGQGAKAGAATLGSLSLLFRGADAHQRSQITIQRCMANRGWQDLSAQQ